MAQGQCQQPGACSSEPPAAAREEAPVRAPAPAPVLPDKPPTAPVIINSCDAGGCSDVNAKRYNGSANSNDGNSDGLYLDSSGRRCVRSGAWLQCS